MSTFPTQTDSMILNDKIADVFSYPGAEYKKTVAAFTQQLQSSSISSPDWDQFQAYIAQTDLNTIEELYTATFDMNPSSCLELGWHLYGEAYQRGEFMVHMRRELVSCSIPESVELPDHLNHVLKLLGNKVDDDTNEFVVEFIIPPIEKIYKSVKEENPFRSALDTLISILKQNYQIEENA